MKTCLRPKLSLSSTTTSGVQYGSGLGVNEAVKWYFACHVWVACVVANYSILGVMLHRSPQAECVFLVERHGAQIGCSYWLLQESEMRLQLQLWLVHGCLQSRLWLQCSAVRP